MVVKKHFAVKTYFHVLTVVLAFIAGFGFFYAAGTGGNKENMPPLPAAYFFDTHENKVTLADFKGQVVLVNLWATWCPPCVAELPSLDLLQARLRDRNFKVVAISLDRGGWEGVADFLSQRDLENLTVYWDRDRQIPLKWRYEGLPTSFLIDRDGTVVRQYNGAFKWDEAEISAEITALVNGRL